MKEVEKLGLASQCRRLGDAMLTTLTVHWEQQEKNAMVKEQCPWTASSFLGAESGCISLYFR